MATRGNSWPYFACMWEYWIFETRILAVLQKSFFKEILNSDTEWPQWSLVTLCFLDYVLSSDSLLLYKSSNNNYYNFFSKNRNNIFKKESILFLFHKASIAHISSESIPKGLTIFYYLAAFYTEKKKSESMKSSFKNCCINTGHSLFLYCGIVLCFVLFL